MTTNPLQDESFETRFASLEDASRNLSADVQALNSTLLVVADLQSKQREQALRMEKTESDAREAKLAAEDQDRRVKNVGRAIALALAIILPLASILMYWGLTQHVNDLIADQQALRYEQCLQRNLATQANIDRELALAEMDKDSDVSKIHSDSAVSLRKGLVTCKHVLR
jgi:hypothetical protein